MQNYQHIAHQQPTLAQRNGRGQFDKSMKANFLVASLSLGEKCTHAVHDVNKTSNTEKVNKAVGFKNLAKRPRGKSEREEER